MRGGGFAASCVVAKWRRRAHAGREEFLVWVWVGSDGDGECLEFGRCLVGPCAYDVCSYIDLNLITVDKFWML